MPAKKQPTNIRDLRESKSLSQFAVRQAAGLTYSQFVRIERGSGKTTPEEVKAVMDVLKEMEHGTRRLAGRPFKDPKTQAAVEDARANGGSVAEAIGLNIITPARKKAATKKAASTRKTPSAASKKSMAEALASRKKA